MSIDKIYLVSHLKMLQERSIYFHKLKNDEEFLFNEMNKIDLAVIRELMNTYEGKEKINDFRYQILEVLQTGPISKERAEDIKELVAKEYDTDIFRSWQEYFRIFYTFFFNPIKNEVQTALDEVAKALVDCTDNKLTFTIFDFSGAQNQGTHKCQVLLYSTNLTKPTKDEQFIIEFNNGMVNYGYMLQVTQMCKHAVNDVDDVDRIINSLDNSLEYLLLEDLALQKVIAENVMLALDKPSNPDLFSVEVFADSKNNYRDYYKINCYESDTKSDIATKWKFLIGVPIDNFFLLIDRGLREKKSTIPKPQPYKLNGKTSCLKLTGTQYVFAVDNVRPKLSIEIYPRKDGTYLEWGIYLDDSLANSAVDKLSNEFMQKLIEKVEPQYPVLTLENRRFQSHGSVCIVNSMTINQLKELDKPVVDLIIDDLAGLYGGAVEVINEPEVDLTLQKFLAEKVMPLIAVENNGDAFFYNGSQVAEKWASFVKPKTQEFFQIITNQLTKLYPNLPPVTFYTPRAKMPESLAKILYRLDRSFLGEYDLILSVTFRPNSEGETILTWGLYYWGNKEGVSELWNPKEFIQSVYNSVKGKLPEVSFSEESRGTTSTFGVFSREITATELANLNESIIDEIVNDLTIIYAAEEEIMNKLENGTRGMTQNKILYGPPGTGKTYNTINHAVSICEHKSVGDVAKENRDDVLNRFYTLQNSGQVVFTTFHQSMSYEDFVEGIKPETKGDSVVYEVQEGLFKRISDRAETNWLNSLSETLVNFDTLWTSFIEPLEEDDSEIFVETARGKFKIYEVTEKSVRFEKQNGSRLHSLSIKTLKKLYSDSTLIEPMGGLKTYYRALLEVLKKCKAKPVQKETVKPHVIIIDEVNRGNVSAIFGELITLIEPDKRLGADNEITVTLPYSKEKFGVPANLHIIATMNTADRSVEALDTALRRRFTFTEMMSKPELLKSVDGVDVQKMLTVINDRLEILIGRDHTIGHAFFMGDSLKSEEDLKLIFKDKVIPQLQEYFYGDWAKIGLVLGGSFIHKKQYSAEKGNQLTWPKGFDNDFINDREVWELKSMSDWNLVSIYSTAD